MVSGRQASRLACFVLSFALAACAASVQTTPTRFSAAESTGRLDIASSVEVLLPTGYHRTLAEGSRWLKVGTVTQGEVYRPIGTVFTIEGRNVHEAYLILSPRHELLGFYLPGESNVSMLSQPIQLTVKETS